MKKRPNFSDRLWAGTEESLQAHIRLEDVVDGRVAAGWAPEPVDDEEEEDDEDLPYLLSIDGGLATVRIHGPITNDDHWINAYLGRASYPAIRDAVITAALDTNVTRILLDINSGGGAVCGVSDCGAIISTINEEVKPVTAYTGGMMCSAAYWLGCSAGDVFAADVAMVGSIGIITTHMEYSKSLEQDGIKATVMRAGKYKALANAVEPLTVDAKAQIQESLDTAYKLFVQHVAEERNQPYDYVDETQAQGREFMGQQALAVGLIDGVMGYDSLMSSLQVIDDTTSPITNYAGAADCQPSNNNKKRTDDMKKKALTAQAIAAMAAGIELNAEIVADPAIEIVADPAIEIDAEVVADPVKVDAPDALATYLQAQVKEKDSELLALATKAAALEAQLGEQSSSFAALTAIVAKSITAMRIPLKMSAIDLNGMTPTQILAEHAVVAVEYQKEFKVGGVAAVDAATLTDSVPAYDALYQARLDSVRPAAKK